MAALWKTLKWVSISVLIFMMLLTPLVQSSPTRLHGGTTMAEDTATATATAIAKQEVEKSNLVKRWFGKRGGISSADLKKSVQDSAREVPTGPDPLHHNDNPTGLP
ncbi:hypothetical protein LWI28_013625 [Acer negundo]|uniref:Uncharacterized protein n=1 Tax=Acer negundo TaxID=4023 RepID=A0AAD5P207_ACENE|nr:hypothetical protein LWI28_013625 [Acer negundo]KAK4854897.1 hypothetical protein QYF36_002278 [Acer negundo]